MTLEEKHERAQQLVALHKSGKSYAELAELFEMQESAVYMAIRRFKGNPEWMARKQGARNRSKEIAKRRIQGETQAQIAREMGLTRECIRQLEKKAIGDVSWQQLKTEKNKRLLEPFLKLGELKSLCRNCRNNPVYGGSVYCQQCKAMIYPIKQLQSLLQQIRCGKRYWS